MADVRKIITAGEMEPMTPQERADTVQAGCVRSWDDVREPFRSEVTAIAKTLGDQRRRERG